MYDGWREYKYNIFNVDSYNWQAVRVNNQNCWLVWKPVRVILLLKAQSKGLLSLNISTFPSTKAWLGYTCDFVTPTLYAHYGPRSTWHAQSTPLDTTIRGLLALTSSVRSLPRIIKVELPWDHQFILYFICVGPPSRFTVPILWYKFFSQS